MALAEDLDAGLGAALAAGLALDLAAGLLAGLTTDFETDLVLDLAGALPAVLAAGLPLDLAGTLRVGLSASEPMGRTGTESRRVGVRPALTLAFFLATGLRTGSAGLGAPSFRRTGLSPQISSRL